MSDSPGWKTYGLQLLFKRLCNLVHVVSFSRVLKPAEIRGEKAILFQQPSSGDLWLYSVRISALSCKESKQEAVEICFPSSHVLRLPRRGGRRL